MNKNLKKIEIGNIYWAKIQSEFSHPHVVVDKKDGELTIVAITTNAKKGNMPGNIILDVGEGNLEKISIVDVAKVYKIAYEELGEYIGKLSETRVKEILLGRKFLEKSFLQNK